jgi:pyruvate dehydrogenase E1 component beta subunit
MTYTAAIEHALLDRMRADPTVLTMSTLVPDAWTEEFGRLRACTMPISEPAITGMAIGAAATGKRPIVNYRIVTFAFNSFDQIVNQAAKLRYMLGGQCSLPIVFRALYGGGQRMAAQHSQSPYSMFTHVAGIKVVAPSNPADAMALMTAAIEDDNPVLFMEGARLGPLEGLVDPAATVALGSAAVVRPGADVTVVAIGYMVRLALTAAQTLAGEGISVEVIDPRTLAPLDVDTIRASAARTGRLVVVDEAPGTCSMAAEIVACIAEDADAFAALAASPVRVCALPVPIPFSAVLEDHVLPGVDRIVAAILQVTSPAGQRLS